MLISMQLQELKATRIYLFVMFRKELPTKYDFQVLEVKLGNYVKEVRENERFNGLKSIAVLTKRWLKKKSIKYFLRFIFYWKFNDVTGCNNKYGNKYGSHIFNNKVDKD
uniref:Uncharacterized protein n=1 Tax=Lactuca sativa TaxID=4236 RepID=A0A9R1W403_LACSA|nr:hypothetical protein LSAT_V11C300133890 [Lactuca sativa]